MRVNVGVNGLGRVGRALVRHLTEIDELEVVAVNDLADAATLTRLLRSDSTFGPFDHDVNLEGDTLVIDGAKIAVTSISTPADMDWAAGAPNVAEPARQLPARFGAKSSSCD